MSTGTFSSHGVLSAAGSFLESVIGLARNRLELFSAELQEEKYRVIQTMVWIAAAVFAAAMAMAFASLTLVYLFWERARLEVLVSLTIFYVAALGIILWRFKRFVNLQPKLFA